MVWCWRPWCISIKSWVQTLMNVCINVHNVYIHDVSCINMIYETSMMVSEYFQNILLNKSNNNNILILLNHGMYFCHIMLWKIYNLWPKQKKTLNFFKCVTWWWMSIHVILPWDFIISMSKKFNYKLHSAICKYSKQLKNISLNMF
jgi:hypothetical protein